MKKLFLFLMIAAISVIASTPASAKTGTKGNIDNLVPTNIIVKQTITFNDGNTLTVFYKKEGTQCELYSTGNLKDYDINDTRRIKSSNIEIVDHVEGKLVRKASVGEVARIVKRLVNEYL